MLKEFRTFVLRGNVVDLAVAVVIGAAFGALVTSLVENVLTPVIALPGSADFGSLSIEAGPAGPEGDIFYGRFLNSLLSFLLIAAAVFFFVVKPVNTLMNRFKTEPEVTSSTKSCPHCLSSIPAAAERCAFCTQQVAG
ncbi:MAG: large conductance mechanosensitive channel protein MscL [Actinomycetota bacterium]